jgi:hypothetical protein
MIAGWRNCCSRRQWAGRPNSPARCRTLPTSGGSCKLTNLQLIWEEYRQGQNNAYGYSRFCEMYERWGRHGAKVTSASLFVAVLGASTHTFAAPVLDWL